jgi:hypothetical protein
MSASTEPAPTLTGSMINAAPKMLAALEKVAAHIDVNGRCILLPVEEILALREAIRLARGGK